MNGMVVEIWICIIDLVVKEIKGGRWEEMYFWREKLIKKNKKYYNGNREYVKSCMAIIEGKKRSSF